MDWVVDIPGWELNKEPCGTCAHFRYREWGVSFCARKLMAVSADVPVLSPTGASCWEAIEPRVEEVGPTDLVN